MRRYCAAAALLLVATRACPDVSFTARNIAVVGSGESVLAIDVDDDGDIDVLAASKNDDTVNWYENDGSQSFTERIITTLADEVRSTYAIDVDGDGDVDALSASLADDTVAWYENDGSQSFTERVITNSADGARSVFAIDVDGDGEAVLHLPARRRLDLRRVRDARAERRGPVISSSFVVFKKL